MDASAILERLVAIPSWRSPDNPDGEMGVLEYLTEFIQREFPWLRIDHQRVAGNRFNILASDGSPTELLLVAHLDTKPPGTTWVHRPLGEREGERFYGRGAVDPCGGIAALLAALAATGTTRGVGVLLYCDEVYEFHGMRAFLAQAGGRMRPSFILSMQPTQLRIWNGCRGVGEFHPIVRGKSAFAATPEAGQSALSAFIGGIHTLQTFVDAHIDPAFGRMRCNVAACRCGQSRGRHDGREVLGEERNIIPDYAEGVIEVRTFPGVDVDACIAEFERGVVSAGGRLEAAMKRLDFSGFHVPPEQLRPFTDAVTAVLGTATVEPLDSHGYSDVQLLHGQFKVPCVMFGPSGGNYHAADEYVDLESLGRVQAVLERFLQQYRVGAANPAVESRAMRT
ncbi:MAG: M20/M25/M40 family metallo-hydrolase [bacterium]|nr:M20/M25/M40 family metallo-hydrolase [bacterium]